MKGIKTLDEFWVLEEEKKRKALEKKRVLTEEDLKKKVEAEFTKEKESELRKQVYFELKKRIEKAKKEKSFVPTNELGVILLFGKYQEYLGYEILDIHPGFPDCLAKKDGKEVRIEFEFASRNFIKHYHKAKECDLVVCWIKNAELPVETLELRSCLACFIRKEKTMASRKVKGVKVFSYPSYVWKVKETKRRKRR